MERRPTCDSVLGVVNQDVPKLQGELIESVRVLFEEGSHVNVLHLLIMRLERGEFVHVWMI